jgi:HAD superfamily hydrolase (TIGR01484 family)
MIRLLALDLDGTLLGSDGRVPEANGAAIARAIDAGVEVAIATGRRYDFALPILEQLPGPLTLILSNGAIVKSLGGDTLMRRLLPRAVARRVLARTRAHRDSAALIGTFRSWMWCRRAARRARHSVPGPPGRVSARTR